MDLPIPKEKSSSNSRSKSRSNSRSNSSPHSKTKTKSKSRSNSKTKTKSRSNSSPHSKTKTKSKSPKDESELEPSFKLKSSSSPKDEMMTSIQDIDLKMPDVLPGELTYSEKIAKKMEKTFQMHKEVQPFIGSSYFTNLFYLYLFKKYKMNCVITDNSTEIALTFNFQNKENMSVHHENIEDCSQRIFECVKGGQNIIIIPLLFQITIDQIHRGGHANLLIYRVTTGEFEHFEPHGAEYGGIQKKMINKRINGVLSYLV